MSERGRFSNLISSEAMQENMEVAESVEVVVTYEANNYSDVGQTPRQKQTWERLDDGGWLLQRVEMDESGAES